VAAEKVGADIRIGIDPGKKGAIALTSFGQDPLVVDIPVDVTTTKTTRKGKASKSTKSEYDYQGIVRLLDPLIDAKENIDIKFFLEFGQPRPRDTAMTGYAVGVGFGIWHLYFAAFGFPYETVRPAVWKKKMGLQKKDKDAARAKAKQLFPSLAEFMRCKGDDNRAEALLIADFGRRNL
jgi:crossover junction endodeoxyribonuclease RuvC